MQAHCQFIQCSQIYEAISVSRDSLSDGNYLNLACIVLTQRSYPALSKMIHLIETKLHRQHTNNPDADRTIDIDILLFDQRIILNSSQCAIVPHQDIGHKYFVDVPLLEIASSVIHPIHQKPLKEICQPHHQAQDIWPRTDLTPRLMESIEG